MKRRDKRLITLNKTIRKEKQKGRQSAFTAAQWRVLLTLREEWRLQSAKDMDIPSGILDLVLALLEILKLKNIVDDELMSFWLDTIEKDRKDKRKKPTKDVFEENKQFFDELRRREEGRTS